MSRAEARIKNDVVEVCLNKFNKDVLERESFRYIVPTWGKVVFYRQNIKNRKGPCGLNTQKQ